MLTPLILGIFTGVVANFFWIGTRSLLNLPEIDLAFSHYGYLFPLAIIGVAIALHGFFQKQYQTSSLLGPRRQAFVNLFELFHLGTRSLGSIRWIMRTILSFLNAFIGNVVGLEGYLIGLNIATAPIISPAFFIITENRQTFLVSALTAAITVIFNAPFGAPLIVIGFMNLRESNLRFIAVFTSLVTYGTTTLLHHIFSYSPMMVMGHLFLNFKSIDLDHQWQLLILVAIGLGGFCSAFAYLNSYTLAFFDRFFFNFFGSRVRTRLMIVGLCMVFTVWLVPEGYMMASRLWESMSDLQLSSGGAIIIFLELWVLLALIFAAMGTSGLFSPFITLGALLGYSVGSYFVPAWTIPLAIVGGASLFSAVFDLPFAASALVLDLGHDGSMWLLASCGILASHFLSKLLKMKPLQEHLIQEKGLRIVSGKMGNVLASVQISEVVSRDVKIITENANFDQLRELVKYSFYNYVGVVSSTGKFVGVIDLEQLPRFIRRILMISNVTKDVKTVEQILEVKGLMTRPILKLLITDSAEKALHIFKDARCIAAVDGDDIFKGLIFEDVVLARYKKEISKIVLQEPDSSS